MYILMWIIFGGLIGWFASLLTHNNSSMGIVANVIVGLIGAVIGGLITSLLGWGDVSIFTWQGTVFSVLGAIILLAIINSLNRRRL